MKVLVKFLLTITGDSCFELSTTHSTIVGALGLAGFVLSLVLLFQLRILFLSVMSWLLCSVVKHKDVGVF